MNVAECRIRLYAHNSVIYRPTAISQNGKKLPPALRKYMLRKVHSVSKEQIFVVQYDTRTRPFNKQ